MSQEPLPKDLRRFYSINHTEIDCDQLNVIPYKYLAVWTILNCALICLEMAIDRVEDSTHIPSHYASNGDRNQ